MINKILKAGYYLIFAVIIVIVIFLILSTFPMKSGYRAFIILSGSMEPKIHTGSVVAVKMQGEYKIEDVITFGENTKKKKPTTHRIVEIKKDSKGQLLYITKGDANNVHDQQPVKKDEILGKVFLTVPYIGYAVAATQKPIGFILIVIVPAIIVIYDEALNIKKEILKKIDYKKRIKKRKENKLTNNENNEEKKEEI